MERRVEVLREAEVFRRGPFAVREAHLRHERFDGRMSPELTRLVFERGDSVAALVHDVAAEAVLLTEQFRYPTAGNGSGWLLELPAGMVDRETGETAEAAIRRELEEEVGVRVDGLRHVATCYLSPGASSERVTLFYAALTPTMQVGAGGGLAGEAEDIRVLRVPLAAALGKVTAGEIADAKTILALQWLQLHRAALALEQP